MIRDKFIGCDLVKRDIDLIIEALHYKCDNDDDLYKIDDMEELIRYFKRMKKINNVD